MPNLMYKVLNSDCKLNKENIITLSLLKYYYKIYNVTFIIL